MIAMAAAARAVAGSSARWGKPPRSARDTASTISAASSACSSPNRRLSLAASPENTPKHTTGIVASAVTVADDSPSLEASSGNTGGRLVMAGRRLNARATIPATSSAAASRLARTPSVVASTSTPTGGRSPGVMRLSEQRSEHIGHDATVPVVGSLAWCVDPDNGAELDAVRSHGHLARYVA